MLTQTLDRRLFEIIVIINGEKDNTEKLVDDFTSNYVDIQLKKIVIEEAGASKARNVGIKEVSREFSTFVDDDDWISENYLEELYKYSTQNSIVFGQVVDLLPGGERSENNPVLKELCDASMERDPSCDMLKRSLMTVAGKSIPTQYMKRISFDTSLKSGEDIVYFTSLVISNTFKMKILNIQDNVIYFRQLRENSVSQRKISFEFNIVERLEVIQSLNKLFTIPTDSEKEHFIKTMINEHMGFMRAYLSEYKKQYAKVLTKISEFNFMYFPYDLLIPRTPYEQTEIQLLKNSLNDSRKRYREASNHITSFRRQLAETETKLTETETKLTQTKTKLTQTETKSTQTKTKLTQTETKLTQTKTKLTQTETKLTQTKTKLTETETKLTQTKTKLTETETKLTQTETKLTETETKLTQTKTKLTQTKTKLTQTKESLSYRLGHTLLHEKKKLINPKKLLSKIKTLKSILDKKRNQHHNKVPTQPKNTPDHKESTQSKKTPIFKQNNAEIYLSTLGWEENIDKDKPIVMGIFDEFTHTCFQYQYNLIEPRPDNWKGLLDKYPPKFLFIESTWKGNYGSWQYRVAKYTHPPGNELQELVVECKKRNIPTIFWNKEDPVHFDNFKHIAPFFDVVFTSALEAIPKYKELSSAKVEVLQFAAEEHLHNPMKSTERKNAVCFAGSYYANRFQDRREDQLMLLRAAKAYGLEIFDRNYNPDKSIRSDFEFPEEFDNSVIGSLPYAELVKRYKDYKVFLNVNSIIDSKTMFSRRIFELLACGTPVISTQALGVEETFGKDIVWNVKNESEAIKAFETLFTNPKERRRRSLQGIRTVFNHHMYSHRVNQIHKKLFGEDSQNEQRCSMISIVSNKEDLERIEEQYKIQEAPHTTLLYYIVTNNQTLATYKSENIQIVYYEQDPIRRN